MNGWLYLIRNRDLYKIGITKNIEKRMRQLKPDYVVAKFYTKDFVKLERELHHRYKKFRIPQTEYFRLQKSHVKEIKQRINQLACPMSITLLIFIKSLLLFLLLFFFITILISLNIHDIKIVISKSLLWLEKISYALAVFSLFVNSGKFFTFWNELQYRTTKFIFYILFSFLFRIPTFFLY